MVVQFPSQAKNTSTPSCLPSLKVSLSSSAHAGTEAESSATLTATSSSQSLPPATLPLSPVADAYPPQTQPPKIASLPLATDPAFRSPAKLSRRTFCHGIFWTMDGEDLNQMSPTARRRYQKRFYMCRKRAMASGVTVVDVAERLRTGRRPKHHTKNAQASTQASDHPTIPVSCISSGSVPEQQTGIVVEATAAHAPTRLWANPPMQTSDSAHIEGH